VTAPKNKGGRPKARIHFCACGNPAIRKLPCKDWVCSRCDAMEHPTLMIRQARLSEKVVQNPGRAYRYGNRSVPKQFEGV